MSAPTPPRFPRPGSPFREGAAAHPFLADLDGEARAREAEEAAFRTTMKARVAELAERRAFAFRRANVMRSLFDTASRAHDRETAVASAQALLRSRLGWREDSPAREEVLSAYAAVAAAAFAAVGAAAVGTEPALRTGETAPSDAAEADEALRAALSAFEDWYAATREKPFWVLFEHYMPETQLVDF